MSQARQDMMRHVTLASPAARAGTAVDDEALVANGVGRRRSKRARPRRRRVKILFIGANIRAGELLAFDEEYRAIEQAIRAGRHRDVFQLIPKLAARRSDVQDALLEHSPDVVHFACHGSTQAELLLLGQEPGSDPVPATALTSLFGVLRDNLMLVVFNACFTSRQASLIQRCAGLAIGMPGGVRDRTAITFASALYGALAYGRSVGEAFALGAAAAEAADAAASWQPCQPQLFTAPGLDANRVRLVRDPRHRQLRRTGGGIAACALPLFVVTCLGQRDPHDQQPLHTGMIRFAAASVRPGVFAAGSRPPQCRWLTAREDCAELEDPDRVSVIHVESFELDRLEVTNAEYATWLNANRELWKLAAYGIVTTQQEPSVPLVRTEKCGDALTITSGARAHVTLEAIRRPVVCVTWYGAREYCRAQNKRLPLEIEWELAAKGAAGRPFPWGTALPRPDGVAFERRSGAVKHPRVAGDSPQDVSPEGVHDLGGNAAEWVDDDRGKLDEKTVRGGSFGSEGPCKLLGSGRSRVPPAKSQLDIGFRCARSVVEKQQGGS